MGKEPLDPLSQKFKLELGTFGTRVKPKLSLMEDLQLGLKTCKSPEVQTSLRELMSKTVKEFEKECQSLDLKLQKQALVFSKLPPPSAGAKKPDPKKATGKLTLDFDKVIKGVLPPNLGVELYLKPKPMNKFPFIDPKKSMVGVNLKLSF